MTKDGNLGDDQFEFRTNIGNGEAILALWLIIGKEIRKYKYTFIAFVDLEKSFDNVQ